MLKLASLGWDAKRISRNAVRGSLHHAGWQPYQSVNRPGRLTAHRDWLAEQFRQRRGN